MTKKEQPLSNCCYALIVTTTADEGTACFICANCQKPCDPKKECTCKFIEGHSVACSLWEDDGLETRGLTKNEEAKAIIEQMKKQYILSNIPIVNKIVNLKPVCECGEEERERLCKEIEKLLADEGVTEIYRVFNERKGRMSNMEFRPNKYYNQGLNEALEIIRGKK